MSPFRLAYRVAPLHDDQLEERDRLLDAARTQARTRPDRWLAGHCECVGMVCRLPQDARDRPDQRVLVLASNGIVCVGPEVDMRSGREHGMYLLDADRAIENLIESWIEADPEHAVRLRQLTRAGV